MAHEICYLLNATSIIISRMESSSKYFHVEQPEELARFSLNYQWVVLQDEKLAHFDIAGSNSYSGSNIIWQYFSGNLLSLSSYVTAWPQHYSFGCLRRTKGKKFFCVQKASQKCT